VVVVVVVVAEIVMVKRKQRRARPYANTHTRQIMIPLGWLLQTMPLLHQDLYQRSNHNHQQSHHHYQHHRRPCRHRYHNQQYH